MSANTGETTEESRIEPTFEDTRDPEERATAAVEDEGLPEDNPFADVVRELRDDGQSWNEIWEQMEAAYNVVDEGAYEERFTIKPKWKVAAVVPDDHATSGEAYEYYTRTAETVQEAERRVEQATGCRVDPEQSEQVGTSKVS